MARRDPRQLSSAKPASRPAKTVAKRPAATKRTESATQAATSVEHRPAPAYRRARPSRGRTRAGWSVNWLLVAGLSLLVLILIVTALPLR